MHCEEVIVVKKMRLGMHSYTLHLWGLGQNWGIQAAPRPKDIDLMQLMDLAIEWGLDGLHVTGADLETKDDKRLSDIAEKARSKGLYLEYNCSLDEEFDPRLNETFDNSVLVAHKLGAELVKFSLDIRRKPPLYGSCFQPEVMRQLADIHDLIIKAVPTIEKFGIPIAIENHTETYADEILWLVDSVNHPLVGVCVDTVNSFGVLEGPEVAVQKLAPYAICNHVCDHKLSRDQYGARFHGVAIGEGDIDVLKVLNLIRKVSPTDKITFEIEWDIENDTLEVAKEKQLDACKRSIKYLREVLKVGREDEIIDLSR
jgi:sugar phosphate isomerase/epimerase